MGYRWIWRSVALAFLLLQVCSAGQQNPNKATVHIVVVDGFGRDLGEAKIDFFRDMATGQDLAGRFRQNTARSVPYSVYKVRVHQVGFFTSEVKAQVFQPDVWVVVALRVGEELPVFPAPRLRMSGTIRNLDPGEEPVYVRLAGVYSDFMMDTRVKASGLSGTFTLAGVIPDGKYILITIGRTRILDVRQFEVEFPAKSPIVIDLMGGQPGQRRSTGSAAYPPWGLSWTYDRYGNHTNQTVTAGTGGWGGGAGTGGAIEGTNSAGGTAAVLAGAASGGYGFHEGR